MANRFTATEKWIDPWFCELSTNDKLFWIYIVDNCDHAGIWQVNWPLVQFHIKGYVFNEKAFNGRIVKLKDGKWFIPKFIEFQYKTGLNPENRAHLSVINLLKKEGAYKGLTRGWQARKDMDKDKDKDNNNKGVVKGGFQQVIPSLEEVKAYCKERKNSVDPDKWFNFYSAKGWMIGKNKIKDWKAAVRTWEQKEPEQHKLSGKTPCKVRVLSMRASKIPDTEIKQSLLSDYSEAEIDQAMGKR